MIHRIVPRAGVIGLALVAAALTHSTAWASVQIDITTFATGDNKGTATVATLLITQNGVNVDFVLTNSIGNLAGTSSDSFISKIGFCYKGATSLNSSSFINFGGSQPIQASSFAVGLSNLPGGYKFPLKLSFPTSNSKGGTQRFKNGEIATWTIKNVQESDFAGALVLGTGEDALAAAHIQSLANGQSTTYTGVSTTTAVPEASSLLIWAALGLAGCCGIRRKPASPQAARSRLR